MKLQQIGIPVAAVAGLAYGYHALEWMGFFLVLGGLVMWALLHFTRLVKVLERAANRPIGHPNQSAAVRRIANHLANFITFGWLSEDANPVTIG